MKAWASLIPKVSHSSTILVTNSKIKIDLKIYFLGKKDPSSSTAYGVVSFSRDRECALSFAGDKSDKTSAVDMFYSTAEEMRVLDDSDLCAFSGMAQWRVVTRHQT